MRFLSGRLLSFVGASAFAAGLVFSGNPVAAKEQIHIVGSSTVFPFVASVAEKFGSDTDYKTPIVESTGTGGGMKLFCEGVGENTPDLSNASRQIKKSEVELCKSNGVADITEIEIGFDGIVLANDVSRPQLDITIEQLFLALAAKVPVDGKLVDNPYKRWSDVDSSLPDVEIEVYGPPPTSGTRDAFVEIVMERGCKSFKEFEEAYPDKKARKKACHLLREDGAFVEAGENDNLIVQKLKSNPDSFGIFGYSFLEENSSSIQGSKINSVAAEFENISSGKYPVSRSLFVYVKDAHIATTEGLKEFLEELVSDEAMGEDGYLLEEGLIPLTEEKLEEMRDRVDSL